MPTHEQTTDEQTLAVVRRVWGHEALRPLQADAIQCALAGQDALVVLPTGGGKSLCYQVPALVDDGLTIVVSPLIALIKDQVDGLLLNGYPAGGLYSGLSREERDAVTDGVEAGQTKLLFVSPERLLAADFLNWLKSLPSRHNGAGVRRFAIDEAHCISQWGHDFRPEYRQLATLRRHFPDASFQAFTATATERVRQDIVEQLQLDDGKVLVGTFDRPNLVYRVVPRNDREAQICEIAERHAGEAIIVYCISRKDTERIATILSRRGVKAAAYHAGMTHLQRTKVQDKFSREKIDIVVATVAFGMGIDRSNVRCVIHAGLPKSVEAYQQETGRAGRDGLESECVLLYSAGDVSRWAGLYQRSAEENGSSPEFVQVQLDLLGEMQRFAAGMRCRHKYLSEHFGQAYERENCTACDVCLGETETVPDAQTIAQKILSCVARIQKHSGTGFGINHVVDVLRGSKSVKILHRQHDTLSTYGLLSTTAKPLLVSYLNQLIEQGVLEQNHAAYQTLALNEASLRVLKGEREVTLLRAKQPVQRSASGEGVRLSTEEQALFDALREVRRELADERGVPPYVVFADVTLKELAAVRPSTIQAMLKIHGIGSVKAETFGEAFLTAIATWCQSHELSHDASVSDRSVSEPAKMPSVMSGLLTKSAKHFDEGEPFDRVVELTGLASSTVWGHLTRWIAAAEPASIEPWVASSVYERVAAAAASSADSRLKSIFEVMDGEVDYNTIRAVMTHLKATHASGVAAGDEASVPLP